VAQRLGIRSVDVGLVVALLLLGGTGTGRATASQPGLTQPDVTVYVLVTLGALSLLFWRRFPVAMFGLVAAALSTYLALGYAWGPILFSAAVAAGLLAFQRPARLLPWLGAGYAAMLACGFAVRYVRFPPPELSDALLHWPGAVLVWAVLPGTVGVAVRIRRDAALRVRTEQSRRATSEEQLRMAQELHDVVGHGLAVIAMQAGSGLHVLEANPAKTRQALLAIQETARSSLGGLRAEIAALRSAEPENESRPDAEPAGPLRAHEGMADLPRLVERVRSGGIAVQLDLDPGLDPQTLRADVDRAGYRITQEALTNVLRHAGPQATARVLVRAPGTRLVVEIADTGSRGASEGGAAEPVSPGAGIAGMRERAEQAGGRMEVAHLAGGGFRVRAELPAATPQEQPS
jgi:signal transduction histidine kinase